MDNMGLAWVVVLVACLVIEGLTMGVATIWFAIGALIAALSSMLGANLTVQITIFLSVSIILLIFTRPVVAKYLKIGKTKTNVESLIGERAKVISKINNINNEGSVQIKGQIWSARSLYEDMEIDKDAVVYIKRIEGVKLIVSKDE